MLLFTVLAVEYVIWHSTDITVSIESENTSSSNAFAISIQNTAGSTLLFYENGVAGGVIEVLGEDGEWSRFCDVCYSDGDGKSRVIKNRGSTFAQLDPGSEWRISVPEDKVAQMQDGGTYRIKMTYLTQKRYNKYIERGESSEESPTDSEDVSEESAFEESVDETASADESVDESVEASDAVIENIRSGSRIIRLSEEPKEAYFGESISETFIKTFIYNRPESSVSTISIEDSDLLSEEESPEDAILEQDDGSMGD